MLNVNKVKHVYLAVGITDLRKSIDGLGAIVSTNFKLDIYDDAMFVFCNRKKDKIKILHWDNGFWIYYYRIEQGSLKWPNSDDDILDISLKELSWVLKGYEVRTKNKLRIQRGRTHL